GAGRSRWRVRVRGLQAWGLLALFWRCADLPLRSGGPLAAGLPGWAPLSQGSGRRRPWNRPRARRPESGLAAAGAELRRGRRFGCSHPGGRPRPDRGVADGRYRRQEPPGGKALPLENDALHDILDRISRWDAAAWFAHRERYTATFGPLPFLPPECLNA